MVAAITLTRTSSGHSTQEWLVAKSGFVFDSDSYPMQANPSGGYQPQRPNPFDDRGTSDSYDSATKDSSTTNLTAGAGDAMSAFYSEVH